MFDGISINVRDVLKYYRRRNGKEQEPTKNKRTERTIPTKQEKRMVLDTIDRAKAQNYAPKLKMDWDEDKRSNFIRFDHPDDPTASLVAMHEMGTADIRFFKGLITQIGGLGECGKPNSDATADFVMSVIASVKPENEIETMLAAQMATVHQATMMMAQQLTQADMLPQRDSAERGLNKLARTFTMQMDALKRCRAKAQQTVRVVRVTVKDGGQAIVGNVTKWGRGNGEK